MHTSLEIAGRPASTVFDLIGQDEDSITRAIAWAFTSVPAFLHRFLERCGAAQPLGTEILLRIHRWESGGGITDLEIEVPGRLHLVVEAKHGWNLPGAEQLRKYANRPSFAGAGGVRQIVTLSECSAAYARGHLPFEAIDGVPVRHVAWGDLYADATATRPGASVSHRQMLDEFLRYLRSVMTQQDRQSNLVFVVSLGSDAPPYDGWTVSWIDIVEQHRRYFHPVGEHWPKTPPTYMGFRYRGHLQSIHHIDAYEVVDDIGPALGQPSWKVVPNFVYTLGPAIIPPRPVRSGTIYRSARAWAAIDALLVCETISDAVALTNARQ